MGLQTLPAKRTMEALECSAANRPRPAKQQCTIRVGCEAPDYLTNATPSSLSTSDASSTLSASWTSYREPADYESYVNGLNAATEVRSSTPFAASAYYGNSNGQAQVANVCPSTNDFQASHSFTQVNGDAYNCNNVSPVYQNLSAVPPSALPTPQPQQQQQQHQPQNEQVLADRFERVCSSPRPYVQYNGCSREESVAVYQNYNSSSNEVNSRADDRYWSFGYSSQCPKKSTPSNGNYGKCNSFNSNGYQMYGGQTIQRDENGKSYLELGAKAVPEWPMGHNQRSTWPAAHATYPPPPVPVPVKTCTKCGHVISRNSSTPPQPCYRHQRLSVLSLSMLKLNRYRQCSDPSLHRSVLICNTLRHIEDEMEREGLACNLSTEFSNAAASAASAASASAAANCDTCCSHCGTVYNNSSSGSYNQQQAAASFAKSSDCPSGQVPSSSSNSTSSSSSPPVTSSAHFEVNGQTHMGNGSVLCTTTSIINADEEDSGFGDEDSRDIDWSSVFSMSTTSEFDVSIHSTTPVNDSYLFDSNSSDPSLFGAASVVESSCNEFSDLNPSWKSSNLWTSSNGGAVADSSDFGGVRWKSELGDELEGFVHILVGS